MKIISGILTVDELKQMAEKQKSLWGINLYPEMLSDEYIEFDSMINIRPSQGNRSRGVNDGEIRKKIVEIVVLRVKR